MVLFTKFVEVGRVALLSFGPDHGKLCVIVDVVDQNRVLVDGPSDVTGVPRQVISLKRLSLTQFKITIPRSARLGTVRKAFKKAEIEKKWKESAWAKKYAATEQKAKTTDFDRFKQMLARKRTAYKVRQAVSKLRKDYNKKAGKKNPIPRSLF